MGIMSFLFNEDERETYKEETRDINVTISGIVTGISGGGHSEETVLSIPMAKACRDKIVGSIKNLKIELYKTIDDEVVEQIYEDERLTLLNDRPNMTATASDLKEKMVSDLILHGNSYTSIERKSDSNKILELWNLEPSDVTIHPYRNRIKPYIVDDIKIAYTGCNDFLDIEDVMISTMNSDDNGLSGKGAIHFGNKIIQLALNEIEISSNIMKNGTAPSGVVKAETKLSERAFKNLRESWDKMYKGKNNVGGLIILEDGLDYQKMTLSPSELGLSSSRTTTGSEICKLFGVPEQIVDSASNTYGSVEAMNIFFLQYSIAPILRVLEESFNRSLLTQKEKEDGYFFKFNTDDILKTTQQERYDALKTGLDAGILSLNECRLRENLEPIDDDFIKLSLGSVFYYPDKNKLFIPNMGILYDSTTNEVINKDGESNQNPMLQANTNETEKLQNEKVVE